MEQNLPVVAKKVWSLVRVLYYMLRKGISKRKLLLDLNLMMKRGKIAGKALHNLMFHNNRQSSNEADSDHLSFPCPPPGEYEFSCSNSPAYPILSLFNFHKKHHSSNRHAPPENELDMVAVNVALTKALEMIHSETASPALPGFGRSPTVRQLRITDSPYPLSNIEEDNHVDEAAEEFISKFYNELRRQNNKASY